jgi:hypothetical protein
VRDRLRLWKPAHTCLSQDQQGLSVKLGDVDLDCIADVMSQAWESSTRETYGSGLLMFHVFCDNKQISKAQHAPISHILLSAFISELAGTYSGRTIANYVYGIRAWHILHRAAWELNEPEVEALLTGASKLAPPSSKRKKRQPFTPKYIIKLRTQFNLQEPLDAVIFACLTTCFYAAAQVGEFTVPHLDGFNPKKHILPTNLREEEDRNGLKVTILHILHTKSLSEGEDVSWAKQNGLTDPNEALQNHLLINAPPDNNHLFTYRWKRGHRPLMKRTFIGHLAEAA